jgi:hypothetical protein
VPAITVYTAYPISEFTTGIEGISPILATGTTIDTTQLAEVVAAGVANGVTVLEGTPPTVEGPQVAEQVDLGEPLGAAELDDTGNVPADELGNVTAADIDIDGGTP